MSELLLRVCAIRGFLGGDMRLATMVKLNWRGEILHGRTQYVEYHSERWNTLVESGFITHTIDYFNTRGGFME
jgi:hypothetical protein